MNNVNDDSKKKYAIVAVIPIIIILLPLCYSVIHFTFASTPENPELFLEKPDAQYKNCVKDVQYMRFHHWELLRRIREEVVRYGKRGEISLDKCQQCHTSRKQFCDKCHDATSLTPDCFGCHYYP